MINIYKKLIQLSNSLSPLQQNRMIELLDQLNKRSSELEAKNDSLKSQLNTIGFKTYNDHLQKAIDLLKLFGFDEVQFGAITPEFLNWLISETCLVTSYNPKLMNFYLLTSMQQAYFICMLNNEDRNPTYKEVKKCMLTFDDDIEEMKRYLKLSLPELIDKLDGKN